MAYIYIIGRKDPVRVSNPMGREIKKRWLGHDVVPGVDKEVKLDLGDAWSGKYGQIRSIEIEAETKQKPKEEQEPEISPEKREMIKRKLREIRAHYEKVGVLKPKYEEK